MHSTGNRRVDEIDLSDMAFWEEPRELREAAFAARHGRPAVLLGVRRRECLLVR